MKMQACEVWLMIDDSGNYVCCMDEGNLNDTYEDHVGEVAEVLCSRRVKVIVNVPVPEVVTVSVDVPPDGSATAELELVV